MLIHFCLTLAEDTIPALIVWIATSVTNTPDARTITPQSGPGVNELSGWSRRANVLNPADDTGAIRYVSPTPHPQRRLQQVQPPRHGDADSYGYKVTVTLTPTRLDIDATATSHRSTATATATSTRPKRNSRCTADTESYSYDQTSSNCASATYATTSSYTSAAASLTAAYSSGRVPLCLLTDTATDAIITATHSARVR